MPRQSTVAAVSLAALFGASGTLHFVRPEPFDAIVPQALPGSARSWTQLSGAAELALAAGLLTPALRRPAALGAAALLAAVFPANVNMAYRWRHRGPRARAIAYGRLPLQAPLIWWALRAGAKEGS